MMKVLASGGFPFDSLVYCDFKAFMGALEYHLFVKNVKSVTDWEVTAREYSAELHTKFWDGAGEFVSLPVRWEEKIRGGAASSDDEDSEEWFDSSGGPDDY